MFLPNLKFLYVLSNQVTVIVTKFKRKRTTDGKNDRYGLKTVAIGKYLFIYASKAILIFTNCTGYDSQLPINYYGHRYGVSLKVILLCWIDAHLCGSIPLLTLNAISMQQFSRNRQNNHYNR